MLSFKQPSFIKASKNPIIRCNIYPALLYFDSNFWVNYRLQCTYLKFRVTEKATLASVQMICKLVKTFQDTSDLSYGRDIGMTDFRFDGSFRGFPGRRK